MDGWHRGVEDDGPGRAEDGGVVEYQGYQVLERTVFDDHCGSVGLEVGAISVWSRRVGGQGLGLA